MFSNKREANNFEKVFCEFVAALPNLDVFNYVIRDHRYETEMSKFCFMLETFEKSFEDREFKRNKRLTAREIRDKL